MTTSHTDRGHILFVHGLYMHPIVMKPMELWFRKQGFTTSAFGYSTTQDDLETNLKQMRQCVAELECETLHFVGHSMGGRLIRFLFDTDPDQRPGVCVSLGTPHQGARIAHWITENNLGVILGKSTQKGLLNPVLPWRHPNPFGSIAGDGGLGPIMILGGKNIEASDGTVLVSETHFDGEADHLVVPAMHTQLIFKKSVYQQVLHFIEHQRFNHSG